MRKRRTRRSQPLGHLSTSPWTNPKYDYEQKRARNGRMPLTLIDGTSRITIARDLAVIAAAYHATRPCYAQAIQRFAQEIADTYTPALAIANYTTTPAASNTVTETTCAEITLSEKTATEINLAGA